MDLGQNIDAFGLTFQICPFCGQYYKHFMIVNYNSRVVIWANL